MSEKERGDDLTETEVSSKLIHRGYLLEYRIDQVRLPDGKLAPREYVKHPGAVVILPMLDDQTILFERQFRYPVRQHCYELPAGKIEPNEAPAETAKRELLEETGYVADRWHLLATTYPCVGFSDERIELYLARDLKQIGRELDDGEFLETFSLPIDAALQWIARGTITDTKAILGVFWADRIRRAEWKV